MSVICIFLKDAAATSKHREKFEFSAYIISKILHIKLKCS